VLVLPLLAQGRLKLHHWHSPTAKMQQPAVVAKPHRKNPSSKFIRRDARPPLTDDEGDSSFSEHIYENLVNGALFERLTHAAHAWSCDPQNICSMCALRSPLKSDN
jgi:hypothetical protein